MWDLAVGLLGEPLIRDSVHKQTAIVVIVATNDQPIFWGQTVILVSVSRMIFICC